MKTEEATSRSPTARSGTAPWATVRTLLVGGRHDECTPGHLEEMHRSIAGSRLVIIEDASHLCFAEQPEEFNQVINSFMT